MQRFFRTGEPFLGIPVPKLRVIAEGYADLPLTELSNLLHSPVHEHRFIALVILRNRHQRSSPRAKSELHRFYVEHIDCVDNWDLVDNTARTFVGEHMADDPLLIERLARSPNLWHRRIAVIATLAELRAGRPDLTFQIAESLFDDKEDLIRKALGWMLREAGKRSLPELLDFLREHYARLPRTTLRYAIERLPPAQRRQWLKGDVAVLFPRHRVDLGFE